MTVLAFLEFGSRKLLVAGEGPFLRVYDHNTHQLLDSEQVFESQVLHGFCIGPTTKGDSDESWSGAVVVWGGRSVSLIVIEQAPNAIDRFGIHTRRIAQEIQADDWIFDACFTQVASDGPVSNSASHICKAVLVTAHNTVLTFSLDAGSEDKSETLPNLCLIAAGPRSILYSAHVVWQPGKRGLVAAGTAFGEVILWSFLINSHSIYPEKAPSSLLHYTFTGHEGSVFGVRISEEIYHPNINLPKRILASCSDDRTIRIWDISSLESDAFPNDTKELLGAYTIERSRDVAQSESGSCLATAMAHSSRIWGLQFLLRQKDTWNLVSYGEDSTVQVWQLAFDSTARISSKTANFQAVTLRHQSTHAFHYGKNIWAIAEIQNSCSEFLLSTGGADGRIISYAPGTKDPSQAANALSCRWTIKQVYRDTEARAENTRAPCNTCDQSSSTRKALIQCLSGKWLLRRNLNSVISTYPSGLFEGRAVFEAREPTDIAFDLEYLYSESGKFTTEQGFVMQATRQYVYRYQASTDTISIWFVSTVDHWSVDYLFHALEFEKMDFLNGKDSILSRCAKGYHLCVQDDYQAEYIFQIKEAELLQWAVTYTVKGPNKEYTAAASYVRELDFKPLIKNTISTNDLPEAASTGATKQKTASANIDSFKNYAWLDEDRFITSTQYGNILVGTLINKAKASDSIRRTGENLLLVSWENVGQINELRSSCIIANIQSSNAILLGGSDGMIYIYRYPQQFCPVIKLSGKIACLLAQELPLSSSYLSQGEENISFGIVAFASCLNSSIGHFLIIGISGHDLNGFRNVPADYKTIKIFHHKIIELPQNLPNSTPTSSLFIIAHSLLVLGSRSGRLLVYDLYNEKSSITSGYISDHIVGHSGDAVTTIEGVPVVDSADYSQGSYILTTSRDGNYRIHQLLVERKEHEETHIHLHTVHTCAPPFGPSLEGATFIQASNDLLLWGFRGKNFVVWNETKRVEVMTVECGGANRNWAYRFDRDQRSSGSLVWTKASVCNVYSQTETSPEVFRDGGHGREIKAMTISSRLEDDISDWIKFIATGAEDTAIRIFSYNTEKNDHVKKNFKCLGIFTNHATGIQQLKWSSDGRYLFSAGGFEEFFIWRVRPVPCIGIGIVIEARFPSVTESRDLRIMDFDIMEIYVRDSEIEDSVGHHYILSLIYSDSSLRVRLGTDITSPDLS